MTNQAMPELVKIGFSTKDPQMRAKELDSTGVPHPYQVVYDALVDNPRQVESSVHRELKQHHEAKEFFRITVDLATQAIGRVLKQQGKSVLFSNSERHNSSVDTKDGFVLRKAIWERPTGSSKTWTGTAQFVGSCGYCGSNLSVTLTRHDSGVVCPSCFRRNDVTEFLRAVFAT